MFSKITVVRQEQYQQLDGLLKALQQATAKSGAFKESATHSMLAADFCHDTVACMCLYIYIKILYAVFVSYLVIFAVFPGQKRQSSGQSCMLCEVFGRRISPSLYQQLVVKQENGGRC